MTPQAFIARWKDNALSERAGAQPFFDDLCDLLDVAKPRDPENYCFEYGAGKSGGGDGWADVWKRGFFGWENKKPGRDLKAALKQLTDYSLSLENPPLLVVCDRKIIEIHTAFTGYPHEIHTIRLEELEDAKKRQLLRYVFLEPEKLKPGKSTAAITEEVARAFAELAEAMRERGEDGQKVAHFLMQSLFCMFAEDEGLLPARIFSRVLEAAVKNVERAAERIRLLFAAMGERDGFYGSDDIAWFNGGLFNTIDLPNLETSDLVALQRAAAKDWRAINPTIFGTLFERGLNPQSRAQLGAHYTDVGTIEKLINPLLLTPLTEEWAVAREKIAKAVARKDRKSLKVAGDLYHAFLLRLENFRVLDPACGSGNFLYLALRALREVEKRARIEAAEFGLQAGLNMHTGPHNILGLEINEYAAELARVTVWIGDIQWSRANGYPHAANPILRPLDGIAHRDALLNEDGSEADWPKADVIVGNPPFLGGSKKRGELGAEYFNSLNAVFAKHVPGGADLVCYWFYKARRQIEAGECEAAGLVATNSIRGGANRAVLDAIVDSPVGANQAASDATGSVGAGFKPAPTVHCHTFICQNSDSTGNVGAGLVVQPLRIFAAWSDEAWVNDGAAVRVSLICFGKRNGVGARHAVPLLDGQCVETIHADLTAGSGLNLSAARPLPENAACSFQGSQKIGAFDIPGELARSWLKLPNPNGKPNAEVVKPSWNGMDITRRPRDGWIIDFGTNMSEADAALYEKPFEYVVEHVKPERMTNNREVYRRYWWRHGEPRIAMRAEIAKFIRYIATAEVAKHRTFVWMNSNILPDKRLIVIARDDDETFGILSSRFHELWSLRLGATLEDRPCYRPTTCFETFPFPAGLTPKDTKSGVPDMPEAKAIAEAARHLNQLRENWLNPPEWTDWVITPEEEKAGFPKRPVAKPGHANDLKKRTLTNLYNHPPAWLNMAHRALDKAVATAYAWEDYTPEMPDEEILRRLLALNLARST